MKSSYCNGLTSHFKEPLLPIFSQGNVDFSEQLMYTTTDPNFQQITGISPLPCSLPNLPTANGNEISHGPRTSLQAEHNTESSLDTSCASDDSDDIGVIENCEIRHEASSLYEDDQGDKNCTSIKNVEHLSDINVSAAINLPIDSLVEISQHSNVCAGIKNGDQHPSCLETPTIQLDEVSDAIDDSRTPTVQSHQVSDVVDDEITRDDVQMMDHSEPDNCEEPAVKKRRLTPMQGENDGVLTESIL